VQEERRRSGAASAVGRQCARRGAARVSPLCRRAPDSTAAALDDVGCAALRFLAAFVHHCPPNQQLLQAHIDYLLAAIELRPSLASLITTLLQAICAGNRALCGSLSMHTIDAFVGLFVRTNDVACLRFLTQIMAPERRPLPQTQRRVLHALMRAPPSVFAHLVSPKQSGGAVESRCADIVALLERDRSHHLSLVLRASSRGGLAAQPLLAADAAPNKRGKKKTKKAKNNVELLESDDVRAAPRPTTMTNRRRATASSMSLHCSRRLGARASAM
jgi:hypothetical protein